LADGRRDRGSRLEPPHFFRVIAVRVLRPFFRASVTLSERAIGERSFAFLRTDGPKARAPGTETQRSRAFETHLLNDAAAADRTAHEPPIRRAERPSAPSHFKALRDEVLETRIRYRFV
jgi:hypothetical protein